MYGKPGGLVRISIIWKKVLLENSSVPSLACFYGHFHATMVELSSCGRDCCCLKFYYLALYRNPCLPLFLCALILGAANVHFKSSFERKEGPCHFCKMICPLSSGRCNAAFTSVTNIYCVRCSIGCCKRSLSLRNTKKQKEEECVLDKGRIKGGQACRAQIGCLRFEEKWRSVGIW